MCRRGMPQAVHLGTMLKLAATPFGRVLRTTLPKKPAACHIIANLFWMPIGLALGASHLLMGLVLGLTVVQSPYCKRLSSGAAGGEETEQDDADGADDTEEQQ